MPNTKYTFFWGGGTPFSNWTKSKFTYKGIEFNCSEQAMMWEKALCENILLIFNKK